MGNTGFAVIQILFLQQLCARRWFSECFPDLYYVITMILLCDSKYFIIETYDLKSLIIR